MVDGGFTLVETLIAMVLSTIVIALVSHSFLVQNQYYSTQMLRTGAQDNVRAATELMAREIRNTAEDGIVTAGKRTLTLRTPMSITVICAGSGGANRDIMTDGGQTGLDTSEVAGLAVRNDSTWDYQSAMWATLDGSDAASADDCFANGADTVGAWSDFHRLTNVNTLPFATAPVAGDVVMLFRETTFTFMPSVLDTTTYGLFRTTYGGLPVEFATGIDTTAQFQYRTGPGALLDTVLGAGVGNIDGVRIVAQARKRAATGGQDDVMFGWSVMVPLRSIREPG